MTGSGKTLAFLLPLVAGIDNMTKATQAVIVVPTKELAVQIHKELKWMVAGGSQRRKAFPIEVKRAPFSLACSLSTACSFLPM
jgi:superfamily II DNA/RNA helicase